MWTMYGLRLILTVGLILSVCSESATEHKVVCQDSTMKLRCSNSSFAITIQSAIYGRSLPGSIICVNLDHQHSMSDELMCETDVSGIVRERCNGKLNCSIPTDKDTLNEPCPNIYKYLDVEYECEYKPKRDSRQIYRIKNLSQSQTFAVPTGTATPKLKTSTGVIQPTPSLVYKFKKISTVYKIKVRSGSTPSTSWSSSPSRSSSHSVSVTSFSYAQRLTATAAITNLRSTSLPVPSNPTTSKTTENKTARTLTLAGEQGTMKLFHFILSFHIVREENIKKHTATSLVWFLFGLLVGLLIVIAVLAFLRLRRFQQERKGKPNKSSYTKQIVSLDGTMDENIELHPKEIEAMEMESQFGETL